MEKAVWNAAGRRAHVSVCTGGQEEVASWMAGSSGKLTDSFVATFQGVSRGGCDGGVGLAAAVSQGA